jgi:quercetin dioxygenase-like cupin family protein
MTIISMDDRRGTRKGEVMKEEVGVDNRFEVLGIELEWRLRRSDTLGHYCVMAVTMQPGTGVPLHQHPEQEAFFILDGEPEFAVENDGLDWTRAHAGEMVNIPPDAIHGFRNTSDADVKILLTCEGDLGKFFEEAGTPLAANQSPPRNFSPEAIHRVLEIAKRLGQRFPEHA